MTWTAGPGARTGLRREPGRPLKARDISPAAQALSVDEVEFLEADAHGQQAHGEHTGQRGDDFVGLIIAAFITAYLVYALLRPEKL